ncbi:GIY-YIG nuclease family protein [Maribacter algicola]|uniref:GIY-YIG nuclease family protein n=1 Tax=Meishania litoralis TaxID=3434685 RepID=A0ACC7LN40_9FLAO
MAQSAIGGRAEYGPDPVGAHQMEYYVYVLKSIDFGRNYVGFTRNVEKRLRQHNSGKTKSTKPYVPWRILFIETFEIKEDALAREKFLKTGKGREYIKNRPRGATE